MLSLLAALTGCVVYEGNGVTTTESRAIGDFDAVDSTTSVDVELAPAEASGVEVTCDENLLSTILTVVEGDTLVVKLARSGTAFGVPAAVMIEPAGECVVRVAAPALTEGDCSGSGVLRLEGAWEGLAVLDSSGSGGIVVEGSVSSDDLELHNSGAGPVRVAEATVERLDMDSSGAGDVEVEAGSAGELFIENSGAGRALARGVDAASAEVHISGAGDGQITVNGPLTADLSGTGDLHVWGSPQAQDIETTGTGQVIFEE